MNIAFISYEFPPETGSGGIGTYLVNVVAALRASNHTAIVICASKQTEPFWENEHTYRFPCPNMDEFNVLVVKYFLRLHETYRFDLIEGTDFKGWGVLIKQELPLMPYVVKLHTPNYLIDLLQFKPLAGWRKWYFIISCLVHGKKLELKSGPSLEDYREELLALRLADRIAAPTFAIAYKLHSLRLLNESKPVDYVPYPIPIAPDTLKINPRTTLHQPQIVFIGRHEIRKGVIELAQAIPLVLKKYPNAHFTFVGGSSFSPDHKLNMIDFLTKKLYKYQRSITFTEAIEPSLVKDFLDLGDIFVFPSHYESFGMVCAEAMAAGKAVIGSVNGGMAEILQFGDCVLLVDANKQQIFAAIDQLLTNSTLRIRLGEKARSSILANYNERAILSLQLQSYEAAISCCANPKSEAIND